MDDVVAVPSHGGVHAVETMGCTGINRELRVVSGRLPPCRHEQRIVQQRLFGAHQKQGRRHAVARVVERREIRRAPLFGRQTAAGVDRFTETGVVASDGSERDFDLVVLAAGFEVEAFLWPVEYTGRNGAKLGDLWDYDGPRAYVTSLLPGFPNFVMMYGPNSGLVAGSFHSWIEIFSSFFCQIIARTIESGASSFEVTRAAYDEFNEELDERSKTWVFQVEDTGGGYYKNERGRSAVRLPWRTPEFYEKVATPNFDHFDIR